MATPILTLSAGRTARVAGHEPAQLVTAISGLPLASVICDQVASTCFTTASGMGM